MKLNLLYEERIPTLAEYRLLRHSTGWDMPDDAAMAAGLDRSLYAVCVRYKGNIVGTGRVIGDGIYYYIQDVIVLPAHQGQGIGFGIMEKLEAWLDKNAVEFAFIGLMAAGDVKPFYERFGYSVRPANAPGMYKLIKPSKR